METIDIFSSTNFHAEAPVHLVLIGVFLILRWVTAEEPNTDLLVDKMSSDATTKEIANRQKILLWESNGTLIHGSLTGYYLEVLGLQDQVPITREMITHAASQKIKLILSSEPEFTDHQDLIFAARHYLLDQLDFMVSMN